MEERMGHRDGAEAPAPPEAAATAGAAPEAPPRGPSPEEELTAARAEAQLNWDRYLRTAADLENLRRRHQQELERVQRFSLERFASELLGVKDSLEMGLAAAEGEATLEAVRQGTEATLKLLGSVFEKFGIAQVDPTGMPFDPAQHEAISVQTSPDVTSDQVLTAVQKGYLLNGRLLRPARVIVVRPAPAASP
jgi:molecular chaperone GrpE